MSEDVFDQVNETLNLEYSATFKERNFGQHYEDVNGSLRRNKSDDDFIRNRKTKDNSFTSSLSDKDVEGHRISNNYRVLYD